VAPLVVGALVLDLISQPSRYASGGVVGFAWICALSMFLGLIAWYRGLHEGGTARISQLRPSANRHDRIAHLFFRKPITPTDLVCALLVVVFVAV